MGWQDAPLVNSKPAWESAPLVEQRAAPAPPRDTSRGALGFLKPEAMRQTEKYDVLGRGVTGLAETLSQLASGIPSMVAGGIRGIFGGGDADVIERTEAAGTYEPKTEAGKFISKGPQWAMGKLAQFGDFVGTTSREHPMRFGPVVGPALTAIRAIPNEKFQNMVSAVINTATQAAPGALIKPRARATAAPRQTGFRGSTGDLIKDKQLATGVRLKYKFTPAQAENKAGAAFEGLAGGAQLERSLSKSNAKVSNEHWRSIGGLDKKAPLNDASFKEARAPHNAVYKELSGLERRVVGDEFGREVRGILDRTGGEDLPPLKTPRVSELINEWSEVRAFNPSTAVSRIKELRAASRKNFGSLRTPDEQALGYAQRKLADALENELDRHATTLGEADLVSRFRTARTKLAQINDLQYATEGGQASPRKLANLQKRGAPLSGDLKDIADTYQAFDRVLQDPGKIRYHGLFTALDPILAAGVSLGHPALAVPILGRPITRGILASDWYQRGFVRPRPGVGGAAAPQAPAPPLGNARGVVPPTIDPSQGFINRVPLAMRPDFTAGTRRANPSPAPIRPSQPPLRLEDDALKAMPNVSAKPKVTPILSLRRDLRADTPLRDRLADSQMKEALLGLKWKLGQEVKGGQGYVGNTGKIGRTGHLGEPWWFDRPTQWSAKETRIAIDKAVRGEKLTNRETAAVQYLTDVAMGLVQ